jgi:hypothetical protein
MFALLPCYLHICMFTDYSPTEKMKLRIMILAVALVTIIGPAAGRWYSQCQLATALQQCGMNFSINDCKYTAGCRIEFS